MNRDKRKRLDVAISLLNQARDIVEDVSNEEQEGFDNLTEGLQASERGQQMEEAVSNLNDVIDNIDTAISYIEEAQA